MISVRFLLSAIFSVSLMVTTAAGFEVIKPRSGGAPGEEYPQYGDLYGTVEVGVSDISRQRQPRWFESLAKTLFGSDTEGEYIVAVELLNLQNPADEKLLARKMIAHFVINREQSAILPEIFAGKKVTSSASVVWSGILAEGMLIKDTAANVLATRLQVYRSSSQVTRDGIIDLTLDMFNTSSKLIGFEPINAAALVAWKQMKQFSVQLFKGFSNTGDRSITSEALMSFIKAEQTGSIKPKTIIYDIPIDFSKPVSSNNRVQVTITFKTKRSKFNKVDVGPQAKFIAPEEGRFMKGKIGNAGILDYLRSANEGLIPLVKYLEGGTLATGTNVPLSCRLMWHSIRPFVSTSDAAGVYWSVLKTYKPEFEALGQASNFKLCQRDIADKFDRFGLPRVWAD